MTILKEVSVGLGRVEGELIVEYVVDWTVMLEREGVIGMAGREWA